MTTNSTTTSAALYLALVLMMLNVIGILVWMISTGVMTNGIWLAFATIGVLLVISLLCAMRIWVNFRLTSSGWSDPQ